MSSCMACITDKNILIGINMLLVELYNERVELSKKLEANETKFKSVRLNNKQKEILNIILPQLNRNGIINDYLNMKKELLLENFVNPKGLDC